MTENYNNLNWTTDMMAMAAPKEQVSASDLNGLLKGRRFGQNPTLLSPDVPSNNFPLYNEFEQADMVELDEYCKKRGIIGLNLGNMAPRAALDMLRGKVEGTARVETIRKKLIYG